MLQPEILGICAPFGAVTDLAIGYPLILLSWCRYLSVQQFLSWFLVIIQQLMLRAILFNIQTDQCPTESASTILSGFVLLILDRCCLSCHSAVAIVLKSHQSSRFIHHKTFDHEKSRISILSWSVSPFNTCRSAHFSWFNWWNCLSFKTTPRAFA